MKHQRLLVRWWSIAPACSRRCCTSLISVDKAGWEGPYILESLAWLICATHATQVSRSAWLIT